MTYRIHPLLLGEAIVPDMLDVFWSLSSEREKSSVPILAFLIEGASEGPVLVDCGMRDPKRAMTVHKLGPHSSSADQTLEHQLGQFGVKPSDINTLVLTHLHYDHCGQCGLLPNARIVVQRRELMAAAAPMGPKANPIGGKGLFYDRQDIGELVNDFWDRLELLEGDEELFPGFNCVMYADTHTPGNQCIYIETDAGSTAIVGDIARKIDLNIVQGIPPGIYYDLEAMQRALRDIRRRAKIILPTHDWDVLRAGQRF